MLQVPSSDSLAWNKAATMVTVAAVEPDIKAGDLLHNLQAIQMSIELGVKSGAQLVVLPELATSGYVLKSVEEAWRCGMSVADPKFADLSTRLPAECTAVVGYIERDGECLYNSAVIIGSQGVIRNYRKTHLWGAETDFFSRGNDRPPVVPTSSGHLGLAICYDNEFPEIPRSLALRGAEILALPVCWPRVDRPKGQWPPETIMAMAAARASAMVVVVADRTGTERGTTWTGGTAVISPEGWVVAIPDRRGVACAEVQTRPITGKQIGDRNDLFRDRRPNLYE